MNNPFVTNGYVSPKYFCDREKETAKIVSLLTNENNIDVYFPGTSFLSVGYFDQSCPYFFGEIY